MVAERPPRPSASSAGGEFLNRERGSSVFDVLACDRCDGPLRLIALIRQADVTRCM